MAPPEHDTLQALTRESAWLHRLARSLVRDAHRAEDAAQRALLLALQSARREGTPASPRGWLATLLRNVVREDMRSEGRRRDRELLRGGAGEAPGADEALQRLELQQLVVQVIRELDEPYRTTVVLRYLEGLSVRRVARRTGVPVKTVHTRLDRARARLRQKLDRQHGGDGARWLSALLTLPTIHTANLATGVGSMGAGAKLALGSVAAAAVLGGGLWWMQSSSATPARPSVGERVVAAQAPEEVAASAARPATAATAPERSAATDGVTDTLQPTAAVVLLVGRVEDVDGEPVEGASVRLVPEAGAASGAAAPVTSDARGAFALPFDGRAARLTASREGYCEWTAPRVPGEAHGAALADHVIVLAPAVRLGGRVVDVEDQPIAGARVRARVRPHDGAALTWLEWSTESGPDGEFVFEGLPRVDDTALLTGEREGFVAAGLRVTGLGREDLELVLRAYPEGDRVLRGRVLDGAGAPIEGAWVGAATERDFAVAETSDSAGAFTLELPEGVEGDTACTVRAVVPGFRPAVEVLALDGEIPESLTLIVDRPAGAVSGVVVDAAGAPVAGARLVAQESTLFGTVPMEANGVRLNAMLDVESLARSEPCFADDRGRFLLTGLLGDEARVVATDRASLRASAPAVVAAGSTGVRLTLAADPLTRVAGRVVDASGRPFGGLTVRASRRLAGQQDVTVRSNATVTDTEGRFEFEALCAEGAVLRVQGTEMPSTVDHPLAGESKLDDVLIVAGRTLVLTVETNERSRADGFTVVDDRGRPLEITIVTAGGTRLSARRIGVAPGQAQRLEVDERARFIAFHAGHEELDRVPIQRLVGEETRVVWP